MQSLSGVALLLAPAGCASASLNGAGSNAASRTRHIEGSHDVVWFAMQQVLQQDLQIPLADSHSGADRATLVTHSFNIAPQDVHCGARPSGDEPLMRSPVARLEIQVRRWSPSRTEVEFRTEVQGTAVEPDLRRSPEPYRSEGQLERRIVDLTARRMAR